MQRIDDLIFSRLAAREPVVLPGVGTLAITQSGAEFNKYGGLIPPSNKVVFQQEQCEGVPTITELLEQSGVCNADAVALFDKWLQVNRTADGIVIAGSGEIRNCIFMPEEKLEKAMNPAVTHSNESKGMSGSEKTWVALICVFLLILGLGWGFWWYNNSGRDYLASRAGNSGRAGQTEQRADEPSQTLAEGVTVDAEPEDGIIQSGGAAGSQATSVQTEAGQGVKDQSVQSSTQAAQPGRSVASTSTGRVAVSEGAAVKGHYYVVGNIFSVAENADKYIREVSEEFPGVNLDFQKIPYGSKTMVTIFSSPDEKEAANARNRLAVEINNFEIWVKKF